MEKVLLPIDGSDQSRRAIDFFIVTRAKHRGPVEAVLLNVQPTPEIRALAMRPEVILSDLRQSAENELAETRERLVAAGIPSKARIEFGNVAETVVEVAREEGCHQIIMCTRGRGAIAGLLLGSVATKVLHLTDIPVTFVK
jgi:nucleotide-binding universal stress UspA family protein